MHAYIVLASQICVLFLRGPFLYKYAGSFKNGLPLSFTTLNLFLHMQK